MSKLLIICGPTSTGKTKLGLELAKKFTGEIISADSRQVYRGMDVGTGKDLPVSSKFKIQSSKLQLSDQSFRIGYYEVGGMKVWLLDIVDPDYKFNVADYKKCADLVIKDIWQREKLPIVVGGTGFYIKALVDGIETLGVEPDWQLRQELQNYNVTKLQRILEDLDPRRYRKMNVSDRKNPRRLIRAIEIARNGKCQLLNVKTKCHIPKEFPEGNMSNVDKLFVGLTAPNKILYEKIDQRVDERVRNGIEEEIRGLLAKGYNWENSALGTTLAYKEWRDYFEGEKTKKEVIQKWKFDEYDYARRQITWFKKALRQARGEWFDITQGGYQKKVEKIIRSWYS